MAATMGPRLIDRPLRVCLVTRDEPGPTGTSRYVDRLAIGLEERGFDVVTLRTQPSGPAARILAGVGRVVGLDATAFLSAYPPSLAWPRADVYHLTVHTYATALLARRPPGPVLVTVHDLGLHLAEGGARRGPRERIAQAADQLALRCIRRSQGCITVSGWTKQTLVGRLPLRPSAITVTRLGVEHERFFPFRVPADFRDRYGLPSDRRYLLTVGSEAPRKNLPALWRAFALVRARHPDVELLKVGRAYDTAHRAGLRTLAAELGVEDAIRFVDDVPEAELPLFYNVAEGLVMPSLYEGFGLPALEAMACRTPVVASDRAALTELTGPDAALLVDPSSVESIARGIVELLDDPQRAAAMARRGQQRSTAFTWDAMVEQTIAVYRRVVERRRATG